MAFGLALPVGWESVAEYLDVRFAGEVKERDLRERVGTSLPQGLQIRAAGPLRQGGRSLSDLAEVADYLVVLELGEGSGEKDTRESGAFETKLWSSVDELLSRDHVPATRIRRGESIVEDIRQMIVDVWRPRGEEEGEIGLSASLEEAPKVLMRLRTKPYVLRPESVLSALEGEAIWGPRLVRRTAQYWQDESGLRSIDESIELWDSAP